MGSRPPGGLKAGVLAEQQFSRTDTGTPQGGILSPLLANIALGVIEERYERHVWPRRSPTLRTASREIEKRARDARTKDRKYGRVIFFPVRYADDFIILVSVPPGPGQLDRARQAAVEEKARLAQDLKEKLNLELSETKTLTTPVTSAFRFLGHQIKVRPHPSHGWPVSTAVIPRDRTQRLRELIKTLFRRNTLGTRLDERLHSLNPLLRGWSAFYRHAWGASRVFRGIDHYVWWTVFRWLRKKHGTSVERLRRLYGWHKPGGRMLRWHGDTATPFELATVRVGRFSLGQLRKPAFATASMESPVHNERCTPGSEGGARKPAGESQPTRRAPT